MSIMPADVLVQGARNLQFATIENSVRINGGPRPTLRRISIRSDLARSGGTGEAGMGGAEHSTSTVDEFRRSLTRVAGPTGITNCRSIGLSVAHVGDPVDVNAEPKPASGAHVEIRVDIRSKCQGIPSPRRN